MQPPLLRSLALLVIATLLIEPSFAAAAMSGKQFCLSTSDPFTRDALVQAAIFDLSSFNKRSSAATDEEIKFRRMEEAPAASHSLYLLANAFHRFTHQGNSFTKEVEGHRQLGLQEAGLQTKDSAPPRLYRIANLLHRLFRPSERLSIQDWVENWAPALEETVYAFVALPAGTLLGGVYLSGLYHAGYFIGIVLAYSLGALAFGYLNHRHPFRFVDGAWKSGNPDKNDFKLLTLRGFGFRMYTVLIQMALASIALSQNLHLELLRTDPMAALHTTSIVVFLCAVIFFSATGTVSAWMRHAYYTRSDAKTSDGTLPAAAADAEDVNQISADAARPETDDILQPRLLFRTSDLTSRSWQELLTWIYANTRAPRYGPMPTYALTVHVGGVTLNALNSGVGSTYKTWDDSPTMVFALLRAGFSRLEFSQQICASPETIESYLRSQTGVVPRWDQMAEWSFAHFSEAPLKELLESDSGKKALLDRFPRDSANTRELLKNPSANLTLLCKFLTQTANQTSHLTEAKRAYEIIVFLLKNYLQSTGQSASRDGSRLLRWFANQPVEQTAFDALKLAEIAESAPPKIRRALQENSLRSLIHRVQDTNLGYEKKRFAIQILIAALSYSRQRSAVLKALNQTIASAFSRTDDPVARIDAIDDFMTLLEVLHPLDRDEFNYVLKTLCSAPFPHLIDPNGPVVQKHWIEQILKTISYTTAFEGPAIFMPLVRTLIAQLELYPLYARLDEDYPWVDYSIIVNQLTMETEYRTFRRLAIRLFEGFAGNIGTTVSGEIRNLSRRGAYDVGLEGFVRGEIHLRYGPDNVKLMECVITAMRTGSGQDLRQFMERKGFGPLYHQWSQEQTTGNAFFVPHHQNTDVFFKVRPDIQQIYHFVGQILDIHADRVTTSDILRLDTEGWHRLSEVITSVSDKKLAESMEREIEKGDIRIYRLLSERYSPTNLEGIRSRLQSLHLPLVFSRDVEELKNALQTENTFEILNCLLKLDQMVAKEIIQSKPGRIEDIENEFFDYLGSRRNDTSDVVQAISSYYPQDPKFNMLLLDLLLQDISQNVLSRVRDEAFAEAEHPDYLMVIKLLLHLLNRLNLTGLKSQELKDLLMLFSLETPSFTPARLKLLAGRTLRLVDEVSLIFKNKEEAALNLEIDRLLPEQLHPHLAVIETEIEKLRTRLLTHTLNQILFSSPITNTLISVAKLTYEALRRTGSRPSALIPLFKNKPANIPTYLIDPSAEFAKNKSLSLDPQEREAYGEKGSNLILAARWGANVAPAMIAPIGLKLNEVVVRCQNAVSDVEEVILRSNVQMNGNARPMRKLLGSRFGKDLLLSVRSGALFDLPGVLQTIEDVGICIDGPDSNIEFLEQRMGRYAVWDSYRRFVQEYGMGHGIPRIEFSNLIDGTKRHLGVLTKTELSGDDMKMVALGYEALAKQHGVRIPHDPYEQLTEAVRLVYNSWNTNVAQDYLKTQDMGWEAGTTVIVQAMVLGNIQERKGRPSYSGAGVAYTTGVLNTVSSNFGIEGSFGEGVDGADIADGVITPQPIAHLKPKLFSELDNWLGKFAIAFGHDVEVEFTVQDDVIWFLQLKHDLSGTEPMRFGTTGVPIASGDGLSGGALVGLVMPEEVLVEAGLQADTVLAKAKAQNLPLIVFLLQAPPEKTSLFRREGVEGFVAQRGGKGEHSQRIAQYWKLTAIAGVREMRIVPSAEGSTIILKGGHVLKPGDAVSIDGKTGFIYPGILPLTHRAKTISNGSNYKNDVPHKASFATLGAA